MKKDAFEMVLVLGGAGRGGSPYCELWRLFRRSRKRGDAEIEDFTKRNENETTILLLAVFIRYRGGGLGRRRVRFFLLFVFLRVGVRFFFFFCSEGRGVLLMGLWRFHPNGKKRQ